MTVDLNQKPQRKPSDRPNGVRKPYVPPRIISEDLFESKGLACLKVPTGGPEDCSLLFPGSGSVS